MLRISPKGISMKAGNYKIHAKFNFRTFDLISHLNLRIAFEHNRPFGNLTAFDSSGLEVVTDFGSRHLDVTLNIRISVMASGLSGGINKFIQVCVNIVN